MPVLQKEIKMSRNLQKTDNAVYELMGDGFHRGEEILRNRLEIRVNSHPSVSTATDEELLAWSSYFNCGPDGIRERAKSHNKPTQGKP